MVQSKVLIVDDEVEFTETLAERLQSRGMDVHTAYNGGEAIDKVTDVFYDAVVLDISMPGLDGFETMKILLEKNPDLQVILLTGYATVEKGVKAMKLGAHDFLEKPIDLAKLMKKITDAKTEKILMVEKKEEERIKGILESRGW